MKLSTLRRRSFTKKIKDILKKTSNVEITFICYENIENAIDTYKQRYGRFRLNPKIRDGIIKRLLNNKAYSFRKRRLDNIGNSVVAYRSDGHDNFSGYSESCFMDYTHGEDYFYDVEWWKLSNKELNALRDKHIKTVDNTIFYMLEHDLNEYCSEPIVPFKIEYKIKQKRKQKEVVEFIHFKF